MCILRDVATDVADHTTGLCNRILYNFAKILSLHYFLSEPTKSAMSETDILASTSTFVTATGTSFTQAKYNGHLSQFYKLKSQDEQKVVWIL